MNMDTIILQKNMVLELLIFPLVLVKKYLVLMIRRPPRSTLSSSSAASDVYKRQTYGKGAPSPVYNPDWVLKHGVKDGKKRKSIMKVNSVYGLLLAVQSGVGLAALPDYITYNISGITKVLPNEPGKPTETHFVYPSSLKNNARLMAFRNFLFSKVNEWKF